MQANDETYRAWTNDSGKEVMVTISSSKNPLTIKNGQARIPIFVSPNYDIKGTMVLLDFYKNGSSVTEGYGMGGFLDGTPGNWFLILRDAEMYYNTLKDGSYYIVILPQPRR